MTRLLLSLILLTSCSSYHKVSLTFISPRTINFQKAEDEQTDKIRFSDKVLIYNSDTIKVGDGYSVLKPSPNFNNDGENLRTYLFLSADKRLNDYIFLTYYEKQLYCVRILAKDTFHIDSLSHTIETFYNKKFKENRQVSHRQDIRL